MLRQPSGRWIAGVALFAAAAASAIAAGCSTTASSRRSTAVASATATSAPPPATATATPPPTSTPSVTPTPTYAGPSYVFVNNASVPSVSVIDAATNIVVATIPVGISSSQIVLSPDRWRAYVPNRGSDSVSVIDTLTRTVIATVPVGLYPYFGDITPDGSFFYVANNQSNDVSVVDTASLSVVATISGFSFTVAPTLSAAPDGGEVQVPPNNVGFGSALVAIGTANHSVIASVSLGAIYSVTFRPDGSYSYVPSGSSVYVVDRVSHTISTVIPCGNSTIFVCVTPDGSFGYASNYGSNDVTVFSPVTHTVMTTIGTAGVPWRSVASADGSRVYVATSAGAEVIDTSSQSLLAVIPGGSQPYSISFAPNGSFGYLVNQGSDAVTVFSTASLGVLATVSVGASPRVAVVAP